MLGEPTLTDSWALETRATSWAQFRLWQRKRGEQHRHRPADPHNTPGYVDAFRLRFKTAAEGDTFSLGSMRVFPGCSSVPFQLHHKVSPLKKMCTTFILYDNINPNTQGIQHLSANGGNTHFRVTKIWKQGFEFFHFIVILCDCTWASTCSTTRTQPVDADGGWCGHALCPGRYWGERFQLYTTLFSALTSVKGSWRSLPVTPHTRQLLRPRAVRCTCGASAGDSPSSFLTSHTLPAPTTSLRASPPPRLCGGFSL